MARFGWINGDWTPVGRTWLGGLGAVIVTASLFWAAGPVGLLGGGLVAVMWYLLLLPVPYAVAGGHVIALPLVGTPNLEVLVALEAGFLAILAAPMVRDRRPHRSVGLLAVISAALGAVAWLGWATWEPRWLVGMALVGLFGVGLYGIHRYSVVALELQGAEPRA